MNSISITNSTTRGNYSVDIDLENVYSQFFDYTKKITYPLVSRINNVAKSFWNVWTSTA